MRQNHARQERQRAADDNNINKIDAGRGGRVGQTARTYQTRHILAVAA